jgi:hypothetical protein
VADCLKNNEPGRIRTGDLRRVKARNSLYSFEPKGISSQSSCVQLCKSNFMLQNPPQVGLSELQLFFIKNELASYVKARTLGLSDKTILGLIRRQKCSEMSRWYGEQGAHGLASSIYFE